MTGIEGSVPPSCTDTHASELVLASERWTRRSIAVPNKHGRPQLCIFLDLSNLNQAMARKLFYCRTPDDSFHMLSQAKFTIVDVSSGYYYFEHGETSSFLTAFNTPFGRFRFTRMPFGLTLAQTGYHFQQSRLLYRHHWWYDSMEWRNWWEWSW